MESAEPTNDTKFTEWYFSEGQALPAGLSLNAETGVIFGIPMAVSEPRTVLIFASNPKGVASAEVSIQIRLGRCPLDGPWPITPVGETSVYQCSTQGSYVGTQRRVCKLGASDGEWERATGMCVSILMVGVLVVVGVLAVLVVVFITIRLTRRRKAVGGVKKQKQKQTQTQNVQKKREKKRNVKV